MPEEASHRPTEAVGRGGADLAARRGRQAAPKAPDLGDRRVLAGQHRPPLGRPGILIEHDRNDTCGPRRVAPPSSVAAHRCGDVGLVARRVGQRPPGWREFVAHHAATGGERCRDTSLGLLVRHPDRDVDRAAASCLGSRIGSNQNDRPAAARIDEVLVGAVAARLVPEHGPPERHHFGGGWRARDDQHGSGPRTGRPDRPSSRAAAEI